jgi:hypothetical protein
VCPAAVNANRNAIQMIFSQSLVSLNELLVGYLSASSGIASAFPSVDNDIG